MAFVRRDPVNGNSAKPCRAPSPVPKHLDDDDPNRESELQGFLEYREILLLYEKIWVVLEGC